MSGGDMRSGDTNKLFQLCKDFENHVRRFDDYTRRENARFDRLIEVQQKNTEAITNLADSVSQVVTETHDIVKLHRDFQGAATVGKGVQNALIWCLKWGGVLGVAAALIKVLIDNYKQPGG